MAFIPVLLEGAFSDIYGLADYSDLGFSLTKVAKKAVKKVSKAVDTTTKAADKYVPATAAIQAAKKVANQAVATAKTVANNAITAERSGANALKTATTATSNMVKKIAEHATASATEVAYKAMQSVAGKKAADALKAASTAIGKAKEKWEDTARSAISAVKSLDGKIKDAASKAAGIAKEVMAHKGAALDALKSAGGKLTDAMMSAKDKIQSVIGSAANTMAQKAKNALNTLKDKAMNAAEAFKDNVIDIKNAIQGELANVKASVTNFASEGFDKLRNGLGDLKNQMESRTKEIASFVQDTIKEQGANLANLAKQTQDYYAALRSGQQEIREFAKQKLLETTNAISRGVKDTTAIIKARFDVADKAFTQANLERNIIRNDVLKTKEMIMQKTQEQAEKLKNVEERLVDTHSAIKWTAGIAIAAPILLFLVL